MVRTCHTLCVKMSSVHINIYRKQWKDTLFRLHVHTTCMYMYCIYMQYIPGSESVVAMVIRGTGLDSGS